MGHMHMRCPVYLWHANQFRPSYIAFKLTILVTLMKKKINYNFGKYDMSCAPTIFLTNFSNKIK